MNKFVDAITLSVSHEPHIIAITESWLHDIISDPEIDIRNYRLFRKDKKDRDGGPLLFIRSFLRSKQKIQLIHDDSSFTDVVASIIGISKTTLNILCVYRSPRSTCDEDAKRLEILFQLKVREILE